MGDSTAAGLGHGPLPHPSQQDKACHRSADAYARDLAAASRQRVLNLACSGATIPAGILGAQNAGGVTVPPTGEASVQPDFAGHRLSDPEPYVQGLHGTAPFHPTAAGELAIALADEQALRHGAAPAQPPSPSG